MRDNAPAAAEPALDPLVWRKQRERWDSLARGMPDLLPATSTKYYRQREIELIGRCFGPLNGKRVLKLDLWNEAVNTRILHWMRSQGAEAFGLDFSRVVTSRAHLNNQGLQHPPHLIEADIRRLPFQDCSFDFVYTMGTIEHINEYRDAVREVHRVLRVGGKAIIGVPHKWDIFLRPLLVQVLDLFGKYPYSPEKSFGFGELRGVVEGCGLKVLHRTGILAFPGIVRMAELFLYKRRVPLHRLAAPVLWPFERMEARWRWLGLFGYLIAMLAEKPA